MTTVSSLAPKTDAVDPYKTLPAAKTNRIRLTSDAPFTPSYVQARLSKKHVDPGSIYASRVKGRQIMLDNPARESQRRKELVEKKRRAQVEKERRKARAGGLGKREAKACGLWKLDKEQAKFALFLPVHHLWQGYMSELLQLPTSSRSSTSPPYPPNTAAMHAKLVKADYHGALITVRDAKNPSLIGCSGIIVHETENAFRVVTGKDETKLLPKQNSIFTFGVPLYSTLSPDHSLSASAAAPSSLAPDQATRTVVDSPHFLFTLYGNQFRFRAAERAGKKFKSKMTIEL